MSNSVVRVTEPTVNDSLILLIGEDGVVTPDKRTVEAYLSRYTASSAIFIFNLMYRF